VIGFFMSHDPGGPGGRSVAWKTVAGGSRTYVRRALDAIGARIELGSEVTKVSELPTGVEVSTRDGAATFDAAVVATHADEARALVENPSDEARTALESVRYKRSVATLHTDASVLPPARER